MSQPMRVKIYATEQEANEAIDAIDASLGSTEILRLPDESEVEVPRKRWANPIEFKDGTWGVPWKDRLTLIEGRSVQVKSKTVSVPLQSELAIKSDQDRNLPVEAVEEIV